MTSRFEIIDTPLPGLKIIQRKPFGDTRGFFERMFCSVDLQALLGEKTVVQINHSFTVQRGTVRGLHFQRPPFAEMKMVSCLIGDVFDVAVDLRGDSPTFLKWHGEVLSAKNHKTMFIPEGFGHGFQTLVDNCTLLYFHTAAFHAEHEEGLMAQDPTLSIRWPEPITEQSPRDKSHQLITGDFGGIRL